MTVHGFTLDGPRRAAELLLRVQAAGPQGLKVYPLAEEWKVSWQTVRRLVAVAEAAAEAIHGSAPSARAAVRGTLERRGRGPDTRLVWLPASESGPRRSRQTEMVALAASLGPWQALGIDDVASVLERQLRGALAEVPAERAALVRDLLARGFYYQPWMPRQMRDNDCVNAVLSALFYRSAITIGQYHSPRSGPRPVSLDPWTLVQALDGLYLLAPETGSTTPAMWALHRMEDVVWQKDTAVVLPRDYRPADLVGHGYGPFIGAPGEVSIRVPASEVPWVLESPLQGQIGEPEALDNGDFRVRLGVGHHLGIDLWARGLGLTVEQPPYPQTRCTNHAAPANATPAETTGTTRRSHHE